MGFISNLAFGPHSKNAPGRARADGNASHQVRRFELSTKLVYHYNFFNDRYAFTVLANVTVFLMTWFTLGNNDQCQITPDDATNFMADRKSVV